MAVDDSCCWWAGEDAIHAANCNPNPINARHMGRCPRVPV